MGYVPYVGFVTHHRATVRTCLCLYKKKKKKKEKKRKERVVTQGVQEESQSLI
jgi:hypothetical protein